MIERRDLPRRRELGATIRVRQNAWLLDRYAYLALRSMEAEAAWLVTTADTALKIELGVMVEEDAEQTDRLRTRVEELRASIERIVPEPRSQGLQLFANELANATDQIEQFVGLFRVLKPALAAAYAGHLASTSPIFDAPTVRLLPSMLATLREQIAWGEAVLARLARTPEQEAKAAAWQAHLEAALRWAGGADGSASGPEPAWRDPSPPRRFLTDLPARDPVMRIYTIADLDAYQPPPTHDRESATRGLLIQYLCGELEAAELLGRVLVDYPELPWAHRRALARQLWDEVRHAECQWRLLEARGGHLGEYPMLLYFYEWVRRESDPLKRLIVLQRVVEGVATDMHRQRALMYQQWEGYEDILAMLDYIVADEETHIGFSEWVNRLAAEQPERQAELMAYQAQMEREMHSYIHRAQAKRGGKGIWAVTYPVPAG